MIIEAMTISKIKHIYIMLLDAIMKGNIDNVDHYLDDELTEKFRKQIESDKENNLKQCYDFLNIANVKIDSQDDNYLYASANVRYCDYKIDKKTNRVVCGSNEKYTRFQASLVFRKRDIHKRLVYKCPQCGSNLNINETSICSYCQKPIDERYSPYVLYKITKY